MELISVRIPKTGSHTLLEYLFDTYGVQYIALPDLKYPAWDERSELYTNRPLAQTIIRKYTRKLREHKFISLHLPVWAFEDIYSGVPRICFMRDPVTWVISCFFFAKSLDHIPQSWGIFQYLELEYRQNWQSWYMDGDTKNFSFIGTLENFDSDVDRLYRMLGKPRPLYVQPQNVAPDPLYYRVKKDLLKDKMFIRTVKKVFKLDYQLYNEVLHVSA